MANLSSAQILDLFETPKNKTQIQHCKKQHDRLKFHIHPALDKSELSPAYTSFVEWVKSFLPKDKYEKFEQLLQLPVPTVDLTSEIFTELSRALEGENSFEKFDFNAEALEEDFSLYRQKLQEEEFWKNKAWDAFKTAINSVMVVDLPAAQTGAVPEPYFYLLEIELLHDIDLNWKGQIEYVIFNEGDLTRYVFDDTFYRTYTRATESDAFVLESEVQHSWYNSADERVDGLGYCPASMFWSKAQSVQEVMQRKGSLTNLLSRLDKYIFWDISTEYYETYGTYPIYWEYADECDYTDEQGAECEGGFIKSTAHTDTTVLLDKRPCPKCEKNKYVGPGSIKRVEPPADNTDADLRVPAGIIAVDVPALKNAQERLQQRREFVFTSAVGAGGEPKNDVAKNEKQVKSSFESRENVLLEIKKSFDTIKKWTLETVARLRYGNNFLGATVIGGDEFYLVDEEQLAEAYRRDKEAGLPAYHLATARETLYQTKFRNNPDMVQRMNILAHLEPYADKTITELASLSQAMPGSVNPELLVLKLDFDNYVKRFEAEEMDLLRFGISTSFSVKISSIKQKLLSYVREDSSTRDDWAAAQRPAIQPVTGRTVADL